VRNETNSAWVIVAKKDASGWTPYRQGTALGTASVQPDNRYAHRSNNLSDLGSKWRARANLGVIEDSFDPDFTNNPDAAARRGLVLSTIPNVLNATGSAPMYACRAWVNFYSTGTVGTRASGNVSSITDNGAGDFTVHFTTAMQDANYAANISHGFNGFPNNTENDTGSFQRVNGAAFFRFMIITSSSDEGLDADVVMVSIFR